MAEPMSIPERIRLDQARRARELSREMAIHDAVTREKHAREEGRAEGRYEVGVKLAKNGMSIAEISKLLELDEEKLRCHLNNIPL